MTSVNDLPSVQTLGKGEGVRESGSSPSWKKYVTPLVSAVNHMAARTFREREREKNDFFH